jgi:hypothetical protein
MKFTLPKPQVYDDWKAWGEALVRRLTPGVQAPSAPKVNKADLSQPEEGGLIVYVPDEVGGATLAFSDDSGNWRRVQDGNVVS